MYDIVKNGEMPDSFCPISQWTIVVALPLKNYAISI